MNKYIVLGVFTCVTASAMADGVNDSKVFLLKQVESAKQKHNPNFMKQSLDKLDLIDSKDATVLNAWIDYANLTHNKELMATKKQILAKVPQVVAVPTVVSTPQNNNTKEAVKETTVVAVQKTERTKTTPVVDKKTTLAPIKTQVIDTTEQKLSQLKHTYEELEKKQTVKKLLTLQRQIVALDSKNVWATFKLANLLVKNQQEKKARAVFQEFFKQNPMQNNVAESQHAYLVFLNGLDDDVEIVKYGALAQQTKDNQQIIESAKKRLEIKSLLAQEKRYKAENNLQALALVQQKIMNVSPYDVWAMYHLASTYNKLGNTAQANAVFEKYGFQKDRDYYQAFLTYLSNTDQNQKIVDVVQGLSANLLTEKMAEIGQVAQRHISLQRAQTLWKNGNKDQAISVLSTLPYDKEIALQQAEWWVAQKNDVQAEQVYQNIIEHHDADIDTNLALLQLYQRTSQKAKITDTMLNDLMNAHLSGYQNQKLLDILVYVDQQQRIEKFSQQLDATQTGHPSQENALMKHDIATWYTQHQAPQKALEEWKKATYYAEISPKIPQDDLQFTQSLRRNTQDDWLKKKIKSASSDVYQQNDQLITTGLNVSHYSGTSGYSSVDQQTLFVLNQFPLWQGRAKLQYDWSQYNAGTFSENDPSWGTCKTVGCQQTSQKKNMGVASFDWRNQTWQFDIGQIPKYHQKFDVLGGVAWSHDVADLFSYTLRLERRRLNNSLLSFYGQQDTHTKTVWGGVNVTQVGLNLSKSLTPHAGLWSYTDLGQLTGQNVADNNRIRSFAGVYNHIIDEDHQRLTLGVNSGFMHYKQNLGDYTLGQGGYYSPQRSMSLTLPIRWLRSTEQTSFGLESSIGYSWAKHASYDRYPLKQLTPNVLSDRTVREDAGTSQGVGYAFKLFAERRITPHVFVGGSFNLEYQKDYSPSNAMIYLKYSKNGWNGDMDLPIKMPMLYSDK